MAKACGEEKKQKEEWSQVEIRLALSCGSIKGDTASLFDLLQKKRLTCERLGDYAKLLRDTADYIDTVLKEA